MHDAPLKLLRHRQRQVRGRDRLALALLRAGDEHGAQVAGAFGVREAGAQLAILFRGERLRRQAGDEQRAEADGVALDRVVGGGRRWTGGRRRAGDVHGGAPGTMLRPRAGSGAGGVGMSMVIGTVAVHRRRGDRRRRRCADAAGAERRAFALGFVENVLNAAHFSSL